MSKTGTNMGEYSSKTSEENGLFEKVALGSSRKLNEKNLTFIYFLLKRPICRTTLRRNSHP